ncbi:MAG: hypothetical protein EXR92_04295 [Gemmatimonadetes bacterium]|nr:hypothetical protein [Gemmatimonadota bacterium]
MAFLNPLFLLGLAAVAIPILLHLLRRREPRFLIFPALRYLTRTTQEHAQIIRLRQILLLALRVLAVALLIAAGARVVLPLGGRDYPPAGIVIVVDNGLSSGGIVGENRLLDSLVLRAEEALERTGERDRIWIVPAGEPWRPSVPLSPAATGSALRSLGYSDVGSDLTSALARAGALLDAAAPELREIVLISDLRREALPAPVPGGEPRTDPVTIAPPPEGTPPSRGISGIRVSGGLPPRAGEAGEVQVEVEVEGEGAEGAVVRGYIEDRLVATGTAGPTGTAILSLPPVAAGWIEGRVELEPDDLRADDSGYFAFRAIPPPGVSTAGSLPADVLDALGVLEDAGRIRSAPMDEAAVHIVSAGALAPPPSGTAVVILPPGDPALLPSLNRILDGLAPGWQLEAAGGSGGIEREVSGGVLLPSLLIRPRVRLAFRIHPGETAGSWSELLTLSDGEPWLIRAAVGDRSIFILGSPLTEDASDLPTSAGMVPFVDLLASLPSGEQGRAGSRAGDPLPVPELAVAVRAPDGTLRPLGGALLYRETGNAGIYRFLDSSGAVISRVAVNTTPPGLEPPYSPEEAVARLAPAWEGIRVADPWPGTVLEERDGREVGRPIAALLFLVLFVEGWLASSGPSGLQALRRSGGE